MKNNVIKIFFVIAILCSGTTLSQSNFQIEISGGTSYNSLGQGTLSNWGNGSIIGGGIGYKISKDIEIMLRLNYSYYPYTGDNLQLTYPSVVGFGYRISGQSSSAFETSVGLRLYAPSKFIKPFISIYSGLYMIKAGEIIISESFDSNPQQVSGIRYFNSGITSKNIFGAIGIGLIVPINSKFGLGIEGRLVQLFDYKGTYIPVTASIQYVL